MDNIPLPPHLLSLVLPPLAQRPPSGLGWPTALIDGWAENVGSKLRKKSYFWRANIADLIGMLFHIAGVQQKVFLKGSQEFGICRSYMEISSTGQHSPYNFYEKFYLNGSPIPRSHPIMPIHPPQIYQQQKFEHKWPNRQ